MTRDEYFAGMLFPLVPVEDWAATHDFELDPMDCPDCGKSLAPDRPFATKTMRGFFYAECECGVLPGFMFGAADPAERTADRKFAAGLFHISPADVLFRWKTVRTST